MKYKLEVHGEICCEECNEIIHNHIDCPICKKKYASTEHNSKIEKEDTLQCECGAKFKLLSDSWYYDCEAELIEEAPPEIS